MSIDSIAACQRVLVVDDHAVSRKFTVSALRQSHCTVKQAATSAVALRLALSWKPHVIVSDMNLPDGNGIELIERLHKTWTAGDATLPAFPRLILLSADIPITLQPPEAEWAFARVLRKPSSVRELVQAVTNLDPRRIAERLPDGSRTLISRLLHREFNQQLDELGDHIANFRFDRARSMLHQLIASAAIAAERQLEEKLRHLDHACSQPADAKRLAAAWYELDAQWRKTAAVGPERSG